MSVGEVDHNYAIGKYEVTAGQYTEFLNAVAKDDPNNLYNPMMADPVSALARTSSEPALLPTTCTPLTPTGPTGR